MCLWVAQTKNERQLFVCEIMGKVLHPSDLSLPILITYIAVTILPVHKQMFIGAESNKHLLQKMEYFLVK